MGRKRKLARRAKQKTKQKPAPAPPLKRGAPLQETRPSRKRRFLKAFSELGSVRAAALAAGVNNRTHYRWKKTDPKYRAAFRDAYRELCQRAEEELRKRAVEGWLEPIYHGGKAVGAKKLYSDKLLIVWLKRLMPRRYAERLHINVPSLDAAIEHELEKLARFGQAPAPPTIAPESGEGGGETKQRERGASDASGSPALPPGPN